MQTSTIPAQAQLLPEYGNPPVVEVVCSVLFRSLDTLLAPHLGLLWERFKPDYADCSEAPPIAPVIERFDEKSPSGVQVEMLERPPLPRVWFLRRDGNALIQVQRDRFLHNWRKIRPTDEYPRYGVVKDMFQRHYTVFRDFVRDNGIGQIEPLQYEMTYVNHIPQGEGWSTLDDIARVLPDFSWRTSQARFLSGFEKMNWQTAFLLPHRAGRMHVSVRQGTRPYDNRPVLYMELTVRGMPQDGSADNMWRWFDTAREWIVRGFTDLTGTEIQREVWRRTR